MTATLAACASASAFYWYDWPGSRVRPEPSIINPPDRDKPGNPPIPPPKGTEPGAPPIKTDKPPVGPPEQVPEPAAGLIGLLGLTAVAVARRWWKQK